MSNVFFAKEGEKGLNLTSAAHLCALASQVKAQDEAKLENISFIDTYLSVVGADGENPINKGYTDDQFDEIRTILERVSKMNEFISWFAEGRKALEAYKVEHNLIITEWAKKQNIVLPEPPERPECKELSSLEDIIDDLNIKERQEYLALEARAAVLGKFIHPDQPYESARKEMHKVIAKPYSTKGNGRDTLIYRNKTSINPARVDDVFNILQREYRTLEQHLNHLKSDLRKKLETRNFEERKENERMFSEYHEAVTAYQIEYRKYQSQFDQWQADEMVRLSKIKLAIPDALTSTLQYLNNLTD